MSKQRLSVESAEAALRAWRALAGACVCGCGRRATEWHHIFGQQQFPELADEPDNVVPVAATCHTAHTSARRRFSRRVCIRAERLATTAKRRAYLDRYYEGSRA